MQASWFVFYATCSHSSSPVGRASRPVDIDCSVFCCGGVLLGPAANYSSDDSYKLYLYYIIPQPRCLFWTTERPSPLVVHSRYRRLLCRTLFLILWPSNHNVVWKTAFSPAASDSGSHDPDILLISRSLHYLKAVKRGQLWDAWKLWLADRSYHTSRGRLLRAYYFYEKR